MNTIPRYTLSYRQAEIALVCRLAQRGESLCFVGVAGTGKSNLVQILRDRPEYRAPHLGEESERILFPVVDATVWQGSALHLWQLMLENLQQVTSRLARPVNGEKIIALSDEERLRRRLKNDIDWLCQTMGYRIMFILDDFDSVLREATLDVLEQLAYLRSAGNKEKLCYLVYTKRLPHVLGRSKNLAINSKFYDLVRYNIYALGMYTPGDTQQMLAHLNDMVAAPLSSEALDQIEWLSGRHPRLIKVIFEVWQRETPTHNDLVAFFASKPDVRDECMRIVQGLHEQEQLVAARLAQGRHQAEDEATLDHLRRRGLLVDTPPGWFSPLLQEYLRR
jgi:hypothetical protein